MPPALLSRTRQGFRLFLQAAFYADCRHPTFSHDPDRVPIPFLLHTYTLELRCLPRHPPHRDSSGNIRYPASVLWLCPEMSRSPTPCSRKTKWYRCFPHLPGWSRFSVQYSSEIHCALSFSCFSEESRPSMLCSHQMPDILCLSRFPEWSHCPMQRSS